MNIIIFVGNGKNKNDEIDVNQKSTKNQAMQTSPKTSY